MLVIAHFPNADFPYNYRTIEDFPVGNPYIGYRYLSDSYAMTKRMKKTGHNVWIEIVEMSEDKKEVWFDYVK